jgi:hypothetical protein
MERSTRGNVRRSTTAGHPISESRLSEAQR